jgi:hypothetical protein
MIGETMSEAFDCEAQRLDALLPAGPRLVVIGSTDFWHADSERTCAHLGRLLADIRELVLITGGVEGIGEGVGRSFFQARCAAGQEPRVYHVLPKGEEKWDYGETWFAGSDMAERREVLGRLATLYLAVEGGPGTVHEAQVAAARNAMILPVGRSGGHAAVLYSQGNRPSAVDDQTWSVLGAVSSTPEETALAAWHAVQACLRLTV